MVEVGRGAAVRVPATSANLGPGFDTLGLALALHDEVRVWVTEAGLQVQVTGESAFDVPRDASHLVVHALRRTLSFLGHDVSGLALSSHNRVPHARGLGSSAAAIVSGVLLARALAGLDPDSAATIAIAAEIEGHPDNVAACVLGGLTIAWFQGGVARAVSLPVHPDVTPTVFIPGAGLSTTVARGLLPDQVSHRDAAANAARVAMLVTGLTRRPELLLEATYDTLHQQYRRIAMEPSWELMAALRADGVAAVVSGAGPAVLALGTTAKPVDVDAWTPNGWTGQVLEVEQAGAVYVRPDASGPAGNVG